MIHLFSPQPVGHFPRGNCKAVLAELKEKIAKRKEDLRFLGSQVANPFGSIFTLALLWGLLEPGGKAYERSMKTWFG